LRDAVRGTDDARADALTEATGAAERLETALGDAGRAATGAGAAAGAAANAAEPATEAAVTGWQAVTPALSDYASKARQIGGEICQSFVSAFQSAENAVGQFVKTGKLTTTLESSFSHESVQIGLAVKSQAHPGDVTRQRHVIKVPMRVIIAASAPAARPARSSLALPIRVG
jgi:hypothetical protein